MSAKGVYKVVKAARHSIGSILNVRNYQKSAVDAINDVLYNSPPSSKHEDKHILNCFVKNEPGILSKVSGVMAARGYNIDSLVVSKSEAPDLSRMTITLRGADTILEQARKQLEDLNQVWAVIDLTHSQVIEREILLVKVKTSTDENNTLGPASDKMRFQSGYGNLKSKGDENIAKEIMKHTLKESSDQLKRIKTLTDIFNAKIVDVGADSVMIELVSNSYKAESFYQLLVPFGIIEASRTGSIVMSKIPQPFAFGKQNEDPVTQSIDITDLPPS